MQSDSRSSSDAILAALISMVALLAVIYGVTSAYVESMKPYADWLGE